MFFYKNIWFSAEPQYSKFFSIIFKSVLNIEGVAASENQKIIHVFFCKEVFSVQYFLNFFTIPDQNFLRPS